MITIEGFAPRAAYVERQGNPDVSLRVIRMALKRLKNNKAPGENYNTAEFVRTGRKFLDDILRKAELRGVFLFQDASVPKDEDFVLIVSDDVRMPDVVSYCRSRKQTRSRSVCDVHTRTKDRHISQNEEGWQI
ncbi:hypothetical protein EVAR_96844_1 [Eumeta japonica]|uniref:Uncharacterized protein n=1 Tax=Eumeta variegata TaxID=151549 RepID=A0A4C1WDQ2_EUMVA|nr:hypothetical protein EVAR_96844_1 [Eumeta japonica]